MDHQVPAWADVNFAFQWAEDAEKISRHASSIIGQLQETFKVGGENDSVGLRFEATDEDRSIARITSRIANGRIRLDYVVESDEVHGRLVIEKESYSINDEPAWVEVWALRCDTNSQLWINRHGDAAEFDLRGHGKADRDSKKVKLGLYIYYALAQKQ